MREFSRRKLFSRATIAPFAGAILSTGARAGGAAGPTPAAGATPNDVQAQARERVRQRYFPDITLLTQDGKRVRFYDDLIKDKIVTINFFFCHCKDVCPLVTYNLAKVQKLLGDRVGRDIFMNSITLKPQEDTPGELKNFMKQFDVNPVGWTFLTGKPEDIERLRKRLGFTNPDPKLDKDADQHIGNVRYGNEPLMLWGACPGMAKPSFIAESISWMIRPETKLVIGKRSADL